MRTSWKLIGVAVVIVLSADAALACGALPPHAEVWTLDATLQDGDQLEVECTSYDGGFSSVFLSATADNTRRPLAALAADAKPRKTFRHGLADGSVKRYRRWMFQARMTLMVPRGGHVRAVASMHGGQAYCRFSTARYWLDAQPVYTSIPRGRIRWDAADPLDTTLATTAETISFAAGDEGALLAIDERGRVAQNAGSKPSLLEWGEPGTRHFVHRGLADDAAAWLWWVELPADL